MLRRRLAYAVAATSLGGGASSSSPMSATITDAARSSPLFCAGRHVTSRGQFNPLHDFSAGVADPQRRAQNEKDFEKMVTNPGPVRVGYSSDYLDWLYRAYKSKMKYADMRIKAEKVFSGALFTQQQSTNSANGAALSDRERDAISALPGAPPPGHFLRPSRSTRRTSGEYKRSEAQKTLDKVAQQQGVLDLLERQPQFPAVHIDKASRFHVVELFKELVLDRAMEPAEVWDKALLYRAILNERKASYPASFKYIFESVDDTVLAPAAVADAAGQESPSESQSGLRGRCPSEDDYRYFLYLVKRYYVDNAVEGHVVLRCHRAANAQDLLFSNPPPKDENEVKRAIFASAADAKPTGDVAAEAGTKDDAKASRSGVIRAPNQYPPIEALWRCEENLPLLKVLVFGELNLLVSENPFTKFPNAQAFLTRPSAAASVATAAATGAVGDGDASSGGRGGARQQQQQQQQSRGGPRRGQADAVSLASVIGERRGHLVAPLPRHVATALDGRAGDLRRLQQRHQREDAAAFHQKVLRGANAESSPVSFSSYADWSYFNPRAVRAESREGLHRQAVEALKQYDRASQDIYRVGYEALELETTVRPTEQRGVFPTYVPTLPHFLAQLRKNPHISFLQHVALPAQSRAGEVSKAAELTRLVSQLASAQHRMALEYNKEALRRVNHQKVQVAATLLDNFVAAEWKAVLDGNAGMEASQGASVAAMARRLGSYAPFEHRPLDATGVTTDARMDDYQRWMRAPAAEEASR